MRTVTAKANETWDMLAKRELGYEFFAKDIMIRNQNLSDTVVFNGGEEVNVPEWDIDEESGGSFT